MRSPLGYPPLLGPAQSNDRRASGPIESSRDVMTSEIGLRKWSASSESAINLDIVP